MGEKILKILKGAKVECCEITDPYMNTDRNKNCISIVIKRADFETKTPDYPGSWIIEEDYQPSQKEDLSSKQLPMMQFHQNIPPSILEDSARSKISRNFSHIQSCKLYILD